MPDRDASLNDREAIELPQVCGMAPSPDNDSAPKAPDKPRHDKGLAKDKNKEEKALSDLNDGELKDLLNEALNYKNPKDREGKSKLFNHLLTEAEEDERNARAARAGGSELVRYCNPSAKRNSRHRKKPSSISENMMHGGSLDNLAKEELFGTSKQRTKKSVSARQREGGSLPCNVNSSTIITHELFEEMRKTKAEKMTSDVVEEQRLLEHDTLDQNFQEKGNELPMKYTTRASLQVNVSEHGDSDRNRTVEKKGPPPRAPVFHVFMPRRGPDNEVDGPIQFSTLEQDRKSAPIKSIAPIYGGDCSGTIRISNDTKKVDENGNLHQNLVKAKKKKVLTDKNVVVCNAENVEGHRSDIITDIDKLMEFIGITESGKSLKSKLNRHSSDDSKSKKRAHSSKGKDNRSKLKKSNSLGEISTTNLEDFEFKDKVVMRTNKSAEKPRERRSWGNMEPLPLQNLYTNASAENLESAEFRVVTKKKKSKKRRNSLSGRKTSPPGKGATRGPSPDLRRKSACSVPHSEKSNDSSDVDSVHSLPIDTQRLDLGVSGLNMPVSYADMAKTSDRVNKKNDKVIVPTKETEVKSVSNPCDCYSNKNEAVISPSVPLQTPPDVHNIKNFPAIKVGAADKTKNVCNINKINNKVKNVKNNVNNNKCGADLQTENTILSLATGTEDVPDLCYSSSLPPDIPDVQTIEKIQMLNQGHRPPTSCYDDTTVIVNSQLFNNGNADCLQPQPQPQTYTAVATSGVDCDNMNINTNINAHAHARTNDVIRQRHHYPHHYHPANQQQQRPPPVVILSGYGSKEVPGLVFGFDINEQLLSEDNDTNSNNNVNNEFCCDDFVARYLMPDTYTATSHNHDKIVSYIGAAWEDTVVNLSSGKVQYYSDLL